MKGMVISIFLMTVFALPISVWGALDLDKEVLIIPDTHNEKPYIWNVMRSPRGYELALEYGGPATGLNDQLSLEVKSESPTKMEDVHVFITDKDLHTFVHVRPIKKGEGKYSFKFDAPTTSKYRFEIVFKTDTEWVNLRKDVKLMKVPRNAEPASKPGDEDYSVKIKLYPKKIYADHVGTLLYEISYKGKPLNDIQKVEGVDMQVATWDEDLKEFIYMTPKQNLGGPEVAVSLVFMRPGKHAVFAEFKHNGVIRKIDSVLNVLEEPREDRGGSPEYMRPAY